MPSDRFWSLVETGGSLPLPPGLGRCWPWTGFVGPNGYPYAGSRLAHRVVYEALVGPIPEGLQLDHLCHTLDRTCPGGPTCRHRRCVSPGHLEPVTGQENAERATTRRAA
jgi:hypothetical protein